MTDYEKEQLSSIRPGSFRSMHGFVFLWHGDQPKPVPPGAKRNPREGMPVIIISWERAGTPSEIFSLYHQSLN